MEELVEAEIDVSGDTPQDLLTTVNAILARYTAVYSVVAIEGLDIQDEKGSIKLLLGERKTP